MARHFTVEEANQTLRIVEPVLREAVDRKQELDLAAQRLAESLERVAENGHAREMAERHHLVESLRQDIVERLQFITQLGVQIKDLDIGLIDFPSVRDGREVLLCWRLGESDVGYWHTEEDGFLGRRPI